MMRPGPAARLARATTGIAVLALLRVAAAQGQPLPPSPHVLLTGRIPPPPLVDAGPPCLPAREVAALEEVRALALAGDAAAAARQLPAAAALAQEEPAEVALLEAVLEARTAPPAETRRALERLGAALAAAGASPESRACAHLERARRELLAGLAPEAGVSVQRARRELPLAAPLEETALFYRAESLAQGSTPREAVELYRRLQESDSERIAAVAHLRLAALQGDADAAPEAYRRLAEATERSAALGLDLGGWSSLLAERALAAERLRDAHGWLARAEDLEAGAGVSSIRKADVLVALERRDNARRTLERVAEGAPSPAVRDLAQTRLAVHGLVEEGEDARRDRLRRAAQSQHRRVALHARGALAHRLRAEGELDAALGQLVRLAYDGPDPRVTPHFRPDLDAVLQRMTEGSEGSDCSGVVLRLGGRRSVLLRHAGIAEPFLRLGDCYLALDMPTAALGTYREISKAFGAPIAPALTLRLARASLRASELPAVRAALRAASARAGAEGAPDRARWALLRADLELAEQRFEEAARTLLSLARDEGLDREEQERVLVELARVASRGHAPEGAGSVLRRVVLEDSEAATALSAAARAEIALHAADLHRASGQNETARRLYALASEHLPEETLRARAAYERGRLESSVDPAREAWQRAAETENGGLWSRLARNELRLVRLRAAVGRDGGSAQ